MPINTNLLKSMDANHRINVLRAEHDPLTGTPLEQFLVEWIEELIDEQAKFAPLAEVDDLALVVPMIQTAQEFSCYDAGDLRAKLERADKFYDIADEAGDLFSRLASLVSSTL